MGFYAQVFSIFSALATLAMYYKHIFLIEIWPKHDFNLQHVEWFPQPRPQYIEKTFLH